MPSTTRARAAATVLLLALVATAVPAGAAEESPTLLTDPYLGAPGRTSTSVAWVTEWAGERHRVLVGDGVGELSDDDLARLAEGVTLRGRTARGVRVHDAETTAFSRTREDAASQVPGQTYTGITDRPLWRHEVEVSRLRPGARVPYRVLSVADGGAWTASDVFSLAPLPRHRQAQQILLTSDHQLMPNTPANLQSVVDTVGQVDAVFLAGDLVNIPDRASEWFDDARGGAFFPGLQGRANRMVEKNGVATTYRGGEILQHAPLYAAVGNHEVMGRTAGPTLGEQFNTPVPRDVAKAAYDEVADEVNPGGDPAVRERWITDNSFNWDTYEELFTLPSSAEGGEGYWATTIGDVRLITLNATQIWRPKNATQDSRNAFREASGTHGDELAQGWGQHIFEPVERGSEQYEWLREELAGPEFRRARTTVVMFHHPVHTLGDNVSPPFTDPVRIEERDPDGTLTRIRYEYPKAEDHLVRDLEPLFADAGVDLVFNGHSHIWNRFEGPTGVDYLETSNVGNNYGAFTEESGRRRPVPPPPWDASNYTAVGDPNGLEPIVPTVAPLTGADGAPLPYVTSNDVSVFSILDTGTQEVTSYAYDLRTPDQPARVIDRFSLR